MGGSPPSSSEQFFCNTWILGCNSRVVSKLPGVGIATYKIKPHCYEIGRKQDLESTTSSSENSNLAAAAGSSRYLWVGKLLGV